MTLRPTCGARNDLIDRPFTKPCADGCGGIFSRIRDEDLCAAVAFSRDIRHFNQPNVARLLRQYDDRLLQGTLDLNSRTLLLGPTHGHAIAKAIEFNSDDVLQVEQGSLYPALHRLIKRKWISVEEGTSENNRRAKFYRLTAKGRRQLVVETSKWDKMAGAIARILRPAEQGAEQESKP